MILRETHIFDPSPFLRFSQLLVGSLLPRDDWLKKTRVKGYDSKSW